MLPASKYISWIGQRFPWKFCKIIVKRPGPSMKEVLSWQRWLF